MASEMELVITSGVQLVSTVLGVYLAARAAHKNTVEYEVIRAERDGYFMRAALLEELKDNIAAVDAWSADFQAHLDKNPAIVAHAEELKEGADPEILKSGHAWVAWWKAGSAFRLTDINDNPPALTLSTLIWDAMKQQSVTFQLPADFLSSVRRYYRDIAAQHGACDDPQPPRTPAAGRRHHLAGDAVYAGSRGARVPAEAGPPAPRSAQEGRHAGLRPGRRLALDGVMN